MTDRVDQLLAAGVLSQNPHEQAIKDSNGAAHKEMYSFSGYGKYTPIKVSSRTTVNNANLERD